MRGQHLSNDGQQLSGFEQRMLLEELTSRQFYVILRFNLKITYTVGRFSTLIH